MTNHLLLGNIQFCWKHTQFVVEGFVEECELAVRVNALVNVRHSMAVPGTRTRAPAKEFAILGAKKELLGVERNALEATGDPRKVGWVIKSTVKFRSSMMSSDTPSYTDYEINLLQTRKSL